MNSLLSNLGPRYSRRNNTTPIILGFLLLIIAIAVATYFITRDDDDDDGKDKKDEGETVPSIEEPTVKRTLNPDPSNSSESGTTETYEIGGGKTETYQIEYNQGVSQPVEQTSTLSQEELSKNVTIGITWGNKSGFGNTFRLEIEHWMKEFDDTGKGFEKKGDSVIKTKYEHGKAFDTTSQDDIETEDAKYFKNFETGLNHDFTGDGTYSFVGIHAIKIKAKYVANISTNPENTDISLFDGTLEANKSQWVEVKATDLTATLNLTKPETRDYEPIQGSFTMSAVDIKNTAYYVTSSTGVDINTITGGESSVPVYLVPHLTSSANKFYFKFKGSDKYLSWDGSSSFSTVSDTKDALLITFIKSTKDDDDNTRWLRLMADDDKYIVFEEGSAKLKKLADIDSQAVYDTLDWKFTDSESFVDCDKEAARQCIANLNGGVFSLAAADTAEGNACSIKYNCAPGIWF
tara:strand:+ start:76 stop:1461 length:1386 start_codon:yes stop_codon:yes gene_type:complete